MKVVYYIVFFFWYLLSLLPLRFLYIFSDVLYYPLYYCIRYRRKVVRQNLTGSFPDKNEKELIRIEKQYYHFFCDYMIETIKLFSISKKQLKRRMTFGGIDEIVRNWKKRIRTSALFIWDIIVTGNGLPLCPIGYRKIYCADKYTTRYTTKPSTGSSFACATSSAANASR